MFSRKTVGSNVNNNKTTSANGTDGQTDGQTDRVRRNPREEGRIINKIK